MIIQPKGEERDQNALAYFPISFFACVMGMTGLAIAYQKYVYALGINTGIGFILLIVAYLLFTIVVVTYFIKMLRHFPSVVREFNHPVKSNFFSAFSISLLLLSVGTVELWVKAAFCLWVLGTTVHFLLTIIMISRWITQKYQIEQLNPTWFIPVVGNLIIPIAGTRFVHIEFCCFFFCLGLFFWFVLFPLVFYRIVFHDPMPKALFPTLFIMIAPPSVAFISYLKIVGHADSFSKLLLYVAWFFVLLLLAMTPYFLKVDFAVTWWAYTFPLSAVTIASIAAFEMMMYPVFIWIATGLLIVTSLVVILVAFKTILALLHKKVCVPD